MGAASLLFAYINFLACHAGGQCGRINPAILLQNKGLSKMEFIILWLVFGAIAAAIAGSRGASAGMGFVAGALLGPIGIGIAFFLERTTPPKA